MYICLKSYFQYFLEKIKILNMKIYIVLLDNKIKHLIVSAFTYFSFCWM